MTRRYSVGGVIYDEFKLGNKKWELLPWLSDSSNIKLMDTVIIVRRRSEGETKDTYPPLEYKIHTLAWFPSLEKALLKVGLTDVMPGVLSIGDGIKILTKAWGEEAIKNGVLAMKLN